MPDREDANVVSLSMMRASSTFDAQPSSEKVRTIPKDGYQPETAEKWIERELIREGLQAVADKFGITKIERVDALRRERTTLKATELIAGITNDRAMLTRLLEFVGAATSEHSEEFVAYLNFRDALKKSIAAETIAAQATAYLGTSPTTKEGK